MDLPKIIFRSSARVILLILCIVSFSHPLNAQTFTREQVLKDINFVVKALKRNHPNLYAHRTPKEFSAIVEVVKKSVRDEENYYFAISKIQRIMAAVCDEHTSVKLDYKNDFKKLQNEFVLAEHLIVGLETVEIDNRKFDGTNETLEFINYFNPEDIRNYLNEIVNADGCTHSGILMTRYLSPIHNFILGRLLDIDSVYKKKSHTTDDENTRTSLEGSYRFAERIDSLSFGYQSYRRAEILESVNIPFRSGGIQNKFNAKDLGISVYSNPDKSIYYVYSHSFSDGQPQMEQTNKLLRELIRNKPKQVILDLMDNAGGQLRVASHLLSYFLNKSHRIASHIRMRNTKSKPKSQYTFNSKKRQRHFARSAKDFKRVKKIKGQYKLAIRKKAFGNPDYKGNLIVLISPETHSAATVVASVLKRKRKAKLIGYVNAGSTKTSCFASSGLYRLPHSNLAVTIPEVCFDRPKISGQKVGILKPDIEVDPMGYNSINLKLRTLNTALEHIGEQPRLKVRIE